MIDSNIIEYSKLEPLNVSRETFPELEEFRSLILERNKDIIKDYQQRSSKAILNNTWDNRAFSFLDKFEEICNNET